MRFTKSFVVFLGASLLLYSCYGLHRFTLGVDFTDEGVFVSLPMRILFGEKLFASELLTLLRPVSNFLFILYKLDPGITLYEVRLLGWSVHLVAVAILSVYVFRLSGAPFQSLLIASVPLFACHVFGLAPPSYNS